MRRSAPPGHAEGPEGAKDSLAKRLYAMKRGLGVTGHNSLVDVGVGLAPLTPLFGPKCCRPE